MSVFFHSAKKLWCVQWRAGGKQYRKSFKSEQGARHFEADRLRAKETPQEDEVITLGALALMYAKGHRVHPDTARKIVFLLTGSQDKKTGRHNEGPAEFLSDKPAERLNRIDLERMRNNCRRMGTGPATINKSQAYIRAILSWGVEQQIIGVNPWANFRHLKKERRIPVATLADFKSIIAVSPDWLRWSFATAYALALRWGQVELFSLQWSAFNWRRGCVTLAQGKSGRMKVVIPPEWYMREAAARFEEDTKNGLPLVCHRNGKRVVTYNTAWTKALKDAGLSDMDIRPYDLRHVAATELLAAGADLAAVSAQLGHASILTTATTYSHVIAGAQARAASLMPSIEIKG